MRALVILAALVLASCATAKTVTVVRSCVDPAFPGPPSYSDTPEALAGSPSFAVRYQLIAGNWFPRNARLEALEKQVALCR